jgi:hypothetical protein
MLPTQLSRRRTKNGLSGLGASPCVLLFRGVWLGPNILFYARRSARPAQAAAPGNSTGIWRLI